VAHARPTNATAIKRVTHPDVLPVVSPNKPLQRSGVDKVLGRGRGVAVLDQVVRARVLMPLWPAAERSRWAARHLSRGFQEATA
jgi:hypothetical protein